MAKKRKAQKAHKKPDYAVWENPEAAKADRERRRSGAAGLHVATPNRQRSRDAKKRRAIEESRTND